MSEKRPNVFPSGFQPQQKQEQIRTDKLADLPTHNVSTDDEYEQKRLAVAESVYVSNADALINTGSPMADAIEQMRKRTEEQIRMRDAKLKEMSDKTQSYQEQFETAKVRHQTPVEPKPIKSELTSSVGRFEEPKVAMNPDSYIEMLSQPQFNAAYDLLPLPSEGKLYRNGKKAVKVAYMTTADENILTSPNLLQSGQFLEILINRKLLENGIRYKDLHIGDRNAIMIWLRATAYGEMYPVTVFDEDGNPFETEIDLSTLKIKNLGVDPDEDGLFDFTLPISKYNIKFKLLTVGDVEEIEEMIDYDIKNELPINNVNTYKLRKQIVSINGEKNRELINEFIDNMRVRDAKELREYIDKIDSGVDLEIEVRTPRGGSVKTFLPLSLKFFWPELPI